MKRNHDIFSAKSKLIDSYAIKAVIFVNLIQCTKVWLDPCKYGYNKSLVLGFVTQTCKQFIFT